MSKFLIKIKCSLLYQNIMKFFVCLYYLFLSCLNPQICKKQNVNCFHKSALISGLTLKELRNNNPQKFGLWVQFVNSQDRIEDSTTQVGRIFKILVFSKSLRNIKIHVRPQLSAKYKKKFFNSMKDVRTSRSDNEFLQM